MNKFLYFIREAFRALWEAKMVTFVSIVIVATALFFMVVLTIVSQNIQLVSQKISNEASVVVYLDNGLSDKELLSTYRNIDKLHFVDSSEFTSKDSAIEIFKRYYGSDMLSSVDENPFPASVNIKLKNGYPIKRVKKVLSSVPGVESVSTSDEWLS